MEIENLNLENATRAELLKFVSEQKARNARVSFALEATEAGVWQWDTSDDEVFISSECYTMLGYNAGDQVMDFNEFISKLHPEDRESTLSMVENYVKAYPNSVELEFRIRNQADNYVWVRSIGKLKEMPTSEKPPVIIGTIDNITKRKRLESELAKYQKHLEALISERTKEVEDQNTLILERERAYSTLLQNMQGMAYRYINDGKWSMLYVSEGCKKLTGHSMEKFKSRSVKMEVDVIDKAYVDSVWEYITERLRKKQNFEISYPIKTKEGEHKWVMDRGTGVYDGQANLVYLEGVVVDITDQKRRELQYQMAQKTIDNAPMAIQWIRRDGSYKYVNKTSCEYSGYTKEEFEQKLKAYDFNTSLDKESWDEIFDLRMSKPARDEENLLTVKDGSQIPVLVNGSNIDFEGVMYNCVYINDIRELKKAENRLKEAFDEIATSEEELRQRTEELNTLNDNLVDQKKELENTILKLKEAQDQLIQTEKMASIGVLVAGIAHELNNPINYLSTGGEGLKIIIEDVFEVISKYNEVTPENFKEKLGEIESLKKNLDYDELLVDMTKMTTNINMGAEQASEIIRGLKSFSRMDTNKRDMYDVHHGLDNVLLMLYNTHKYRVKITKDYSPLPEISCYPAKLSQVFMNIINNAIQAIEGEGEVVISTRIEQKDVVVEVKDSGSGVPEHLLNRIFEPFFTTKDTGQGTGLGLSISMGIIEDHGGRIEFFNNDDKGATFRVYLPIESPEEISESREDN